MVAAIIDFTSNSEVFAVFFNVLAYNTKTTHSTQKICNAYIRCNPAMLKWIRRECEIKVKKFKGDDAIENNWIFRTKTTKNAHEIVANKNIQKKMRSKIHKKDLRVKHLLMFQDFGWNYMEKMVSYGRREQKNYCLLLK